MMLKSLLLRINMVDVGAEEVVVALLQEDVVLAVVSGEVMAEDMVEVMMNIMVMAEDMVKDMVMVRNMGMEVDMVGDMAHLMLVVLEKLPEPVEAQEDVDVVEASLHIKVTNKIKRWKPVN